jgi:hypothetical protein
MIMEMFEKISDQKQSYDTVDRSVKAAFTRAYVVHRLHTIDCCIDIAAYIHVC